MDRWVTDIQYQFPAMTTTNIYANYTSWKNPATRAPFSSDLLMGHGSLWRTNKTGVIEALIADARSKNDRQIA